MTKRICALLLCLTLTLGLSALGEPLVGAHGVNVPNVGDVVTFGTYEQDNVLSNGTEPLEWIVLEIKNGCALLYTKYVIDWDYFNSGNGGGEKKYVWKQNTIYEWLNDDFFGSAFTPAEQALLCETTPYGETVGRVTLLSYAEANSLFKSTKARIGLPTKAALAKGAYVWEDGGGCWTWLRTPARVYDYTQRDWDYMDWREAVCGITGNGSMDDWGYIVNRTRRGVRPAVWVKLH